MTFLHSPDGQRIFAEYGFRPVDPGAAGSAAQALPSGVFTIADLGGWESLQNSVYGRQGTWTSIFTVQAMGR